MLELIKYMGNPLWSSVPGGRDAWDLLCITFSACQVLHDSSLLFCAGSGLRLAERVLSWVEDLMGAHPIVIFYTNERDSTDGIDFFCLNKSVLRELGKKWKNLTTEEAMFI